MKTIEERLDAIEKILKEVLALSKDNQSQKFKKKESKRVPLSEWAKANSISNTKRYEMAHCRKYKDVITKVDGRWKVDVVGIENTTQTQEGRGEEVREIKMNWSV